MPWQLPDTYNLADHGRGTATLKFYEDRDNLSEAWQQTATDDLAPV
jgi:hypothetical protein